MENQEKKLEQMEHLWLAINGALTDPGDIPDEFAPGKPCDLLYGAVTDARLRLVARTGIDFEDRDLMTIIESLEQIGKICAFRMYEHGEASVSRETNCTDCQKNKKAPETGP